MSEGRVQDSSYASASTMSAGSPVPPEEHYGPGSDDTASEYSWTALNRGRRKDEDSSSEGHSSVAGHLSSFEEKFQKQSAVHAKRRTETASQGKEIKEQNQELRERTTQSQEMQKLEKCVRTVHQKKERALLESHVPASKGNQAPHNEAGGVAGEPEEPTDSVGNGNGLHALLQTAVGLIQTALKRGRSEDEDSSSQGYSSVASRLSSFEEVDNERALLKETTAHQDQQMQELDNERASQKETIADLEKQMQELDNERASQKETIADLEKQMQELDNERASQKETIADLEKQMQELDNERASQKETIADLEKEMKELDNERASQKETIADLEKQMQELDNERASQKETIADQEKQMQELDNERASQKEKIADLEKEMKELDNERASQKETIADLEKDMKELDNERASQKETIADLEKQMQELVNERASQKETIADLEEQMQELDNELASQRETIADLEKQMQELDNERASQKETIADLKKQLQDTWVKLTGEHEKLKEKSGLQEKIITALSQDIRERVTQTIQMKAEVRRGKEEAAKLIKEMETLKAHHATELKSIEERLRIEHQKQERALLESHVLASKAERYKRALQHTETFLQTLQSSVEEAEKAWSDRARLHQKERQQWQEQLRLAEAVALAREPNDRERRLQERCSDLEDSLRGMHTLQEKVLEMQMKLKETQLMLRARNARGNRIMRYKAQGLGTNID